MRFLPLLLLIGCETDTSPKAPEKPATFVGRQACAPCHELEAQLHAGSHHDLAMDEATPDTVLGDFDGATHEHFGVVTRFTRDGERFLIETDGPDGEPTTFEVAYVFGVDPLQQYLVRFPGGRLQCLGVAWDARPKEEGGGRWFHLYPDEAIPAGDLLHWTGPNQRWNSMCARCHSTGLVRGYNRETMTYDTTWNEIDVSCEACHGPGSDHIEWAEGDQSEAKPFGLTITLSDPAQGQWTIDEDTGNAVRTVPRASRAQSETCARRHSRRAAIREAPVDRSSFHAQYHLSLLDPLNYYPDGQIREEVYVYGSFLQSKMHGRGVTCSDCHDPHTASLLFEGNALCARCHLPSKYDDPSHRFHPAGGEGAQCVDCHMPQRTYMVVDPRRDHSLRVPRPDLSLKIGSPNACDRCHAEQGNEWAAERVREWYPEGRHTQPHYGQAFHAARNGTPDAEVKLVEVAANPDQPAIVRASAIDSLWGASTAETARVILEGLEDPSPLVRAAAARIFDGQPERVEARAQVLPLLTDPILLVRAEAARVLAPLEDLPPEASADFDAALADFVNTQLANADQAGAHLGLGVFRMNRGRLIDAERSFRKALEIDPMFLPAFMNLADVLRERKKDEEGEKVLDASLVLWPRNADLTHALGLLYARTDRQDLAVETLRRAAALDPTSPRFVYAYGIALHSTGHSNEALAVLEEANMRHPGNPDILHALATMYRDAGEPARALPFAEILRELLPQDEGAARLVEGLLQAIEGDG